MMDLQQALRDLCKGVGHLGGCCGGVCGGVEVVPPSSPTTHTTTTTCLDLSGIGIKTLSLNGNQMRHLCRGGLKIKELNLNNNRVSFFPPEIQLLSSTLTSLSLSYNSLSVLPPGTSLHHTQQHTQHTHTHHTQHTQHTHFHHTTH